MDQVLVATICYGGGADGLKIKTAEEFSCFGVMFCLQTVRVYSHPDDMCTIHTIIGDTLDETNSSRL